MTVESKKLTELKKRAAACADSLERTAVLANLESGAYTREQDIETDVAWLERLDEGRRTAESRDS